MKIREVPIDRPKPYPGNPRILDRAISRVAASLQEFGWRQPIVVDADFVVIVGHARLEAAKSLGLEKVPVLVADDLTPQQVRAYRLADNRTGEFATYDDAKLLAELQALSELGSLEVTGFTDSEMLALEMQAQALLDAAPSATARAEPVASPAGSVPAPAPSLESDLDDVGDEPANDHDGDFDGGNDAQADDNQPAMVRFEAIVDEDMRRAIVAALNQAKAKHGIETMGEALHFVCLEWMEKTR